MLQTAGRKSFQKIITSILASALLIFPVILRSNSVIAQNEIWFLSEQPKESLEQNADEIEENLLLSNFYLTKYRQTREIKYLERAIERVQQAIRLQPAFVPARMMLYLCLTEKAIVQTDENLISQLKLHYQALMDSSLEPEQLKNIPPPVYVAGVIYFNMSIEQIEEEELRYEQKAIDALKQAIRINSDFYLSHLLLGRIYYYQDKNDLAFSEVQKAIRLNRNDPDNYVLLGDIHAKNIHRAKDCWDYKAITEGIRAYKQAIRIAPRYVGAHLGLSRMYVHQKAYNLAVMEAKIAVELSDSIYSHYQLGKALLFTEDYKQAIQEYKKAIKQEQDNSYVILHAEIALAHFLQGNYKDAAQKYQQYMALENSAHINPYTVIHYHLVLNKLGRQREAQKLLKDYLLDFDGEEWELALLQFHSNRLSEKKLMSKVSNKCERCEALFFVGYRYLLSGEQEKAQKYFHSSLDTKAYCNTEYLLARAFLNQLDLK